MTRPLVSRATPPYTQLVLDAIARWQFEPARDVDYKGVETTVEMPVTVIAIYRPPILLNAPTIGEPPKDLMKVSGDVAVATATVAPLYPPNARDGGVVLYEIALDEAGRVTETRGVAIGRGFSKRGASMRSRSFDSALDRIERVQCPPPRMSSSVSEFRWGWCRRLGSAPLAPLPPSSGVSSFR